MSCTEASVPRKVRQTDAIRINRLIIHECCICDAFTLEPILEKRLFGTLYLKTSL